MNFLFFAISLKKEACYSKKRVIFNDFRSFYAQGIKIRCRWFLQFRADEFECLLIQKLSEHRLYSFQ